MEPVSVPPAIMAALCLYVGVTYLWHWLRRRDERQYLYFSLSCVLIASYNVFCAGLYGAASPGHGMFWQRLQFASLAAFSVFMALFVHAFTGYRSRRAVLIITLAMAIFFTLGLAVRGPLTFDPADARPKRIVIGTLIDVTYQEVDPGPLYAAQYVCMVAGYVYLLFLLMRHYRDEDPRHTGPVLLAMGLFFAAALNDVMVGAGVYSFLYCVEYAFMAIILSLAYALQSSFIDLHREVDELNRLLEEKVKERTMDLFFSEIGREMSAGIFDGASRPGGAAGRKPPAPGAGKLGRELSIITDIDTLLDRAAARAMELSGADQGHVFLLSDAGKLVLRASRRSPESNTSHYDRALVERAVTENRTVSVENVICVPFTVDGRPAGACCLSSPQRRPFTGDATRSLEAFVRQAAVAFENAFLYQRMINRKRGSAASLSPDIEEKMRRAGRFLEENFRSDVSREGLAASLNLHPDSLSRYFKRYAGKKISDYVNELRVREAARLIRETDRNIIDIAFEAGFESVPTFNRAFQKVLGCPPSRLRE